MKAKRSGELIFKEGRSTVKDIFRSIATELTTEEWAILNRTSDPEVPWTFDINRSIKIPTVMKKDMVRLYRILAKTGYKPTSAPFGEIILLTGNDSERTVYLVIQLNDETISIPIPALTDAEGAATLIATTIAANVPGFADTMVSTANSSVVLVKGINIVRNLTINTNRTDSGIATKTSMITMPTVGHITPLGRATDGVISFTVNGEDFSINTALNDSRAVLANKIVSTVNGVGNGFGARIINPTDSTVEISHSTEDVVSVTSTAFTTANIITETTVESSLAFINFRTELILNPGSMTVSLEGTQFNAISIDARESIPSIAGKLNAIISSAGYIAEAVIGEPRIRIIRTNGTITSAQSSTDAVSSTSAYFNGKANLATKTIGEIELFGELVYNDANYSLSINNKVYNIQLVAGYNKARVLQDMLSAIIVDHPQSFLQSSGITIVPTNTSVDQLSSGFPELVMGNANTASFIRQPTEYSGIIEVLQSAGAAFDMIVRVNYVAHTIIIPEDSTVNEIANLIKTHFADLPEFADTSVVNNIVEIKGSDSVVQVGVDFVNIPDTYYDVQGDLVIGIGTGDNGTKIGDNVIIKIKEVGKLFDYITFTPKEVNGVVRHIADLISRPKGEITLFETEVEQYTKERAMKRNPGEPIFSVNGTNISKASTGINSIKVYKGEAPDTAVLIPREIYQVDYDNGLIMFSSDPLGTNELIYVDYAVITDQILDEVPKHKYQIMDNKIVALDASLEELSGVLFVNYKWELVHPASLLSFVPDQERMVLKTYVDISQVKNKSLFKEYFIEFRRPQLRNDRITGLDVRYGTEVSAENEPTILVDKSSPWSRMAWYKSNSAAQLNLNEDMSISYFMNFTQEYFNLFVQGSAAFDSDYTNYIIAPMMWGLLEKYEGAIYTEDSYNCYFTVGSDKLLAPSNKWGENTGTGITDILIDSTLSNVPYQAHYPSFHTVPEFMNKHYVNVSTETAAEQVGEIIIYHPVEKARGKIQGILTGDRSTIEHLGTLIENRDRYDVSGALLDSENNMYNNCGGPNQSEQRTYVQINVNAPYSLFNNSPNVFYGVCMRKE